MLYEVITVGDKILVTGPSSGVIETVIEEIRVDLKPVEETKKGELFSIKLSDRITSYNVCYTKLLRVIKSSMALKETQYPHLYLLSRILLLHQLCLMLRTLIQITR